MPWFPPALGWLDLLSDRESAYDDHADAGDEHVNLTLSGQYTEPGQAYEHVVGRDYAYGLPALRARILEAILAGVRRGRPHGFKVLLMMAGDGESVNTNPQPGEYNDAVGMTYGHAWLMQNFDRVWTALEGDGTATEPDLTQWIITSPGYDGVVPAWQPPSKVDDYVLMVRDRIGRYRAQAIELSAGYCVWAGDEFNNWTTPAGHAIDTILLEFPYPICATDRTRPPQPPPPVPAGDPQGLRRNWDQVWQIVGRLVRPYHRPPEQPAEDDPHPPYLLGAGTPRGPYVVVLYEWDTYGTVRGLDPAVTEARRAYLRQLTDNALVG